MPNEFSKFEWYRSLAKAVDLSDTEFRVLVLLANYADGTTGGRAFPSAATLAEQTGKSAKTVRRALAALVAKGRLNRVDRPGRTTEYRLVTLDTQMSRVTEDNPGHPDVQGPDNTLDKTTPTLDKAMSTHPGHPDVHRSDQGSDPLRIRSVTRSDHSGQDIEDVQPGEDQDDTGHASRSLAVGGTEATEEVADSRCPERGTSSEPERAAAGSSAEREARLSGPDSDPWGSTSEPATAEGAPEAPEGLVGLQPPTAHGSPFDDPFASEPGWRSEAKAREERAARILEPATAAVPLAPAWD